MSIQEDAVTKTTRTNLLEADRRHCIAHVMNSRAYTWRERLKIWRAMKGLSTDKVAEKLKSCRSSLNAWENGRSNPSRSSAQRIETLTGIPFDDIYGRRKTGLLHRVPDLPPLVRRKGS